MELPQPRKPQKRRARVYRAVVGRIAYSRREALAMTSSLSAPAQSRLLVLRWVEERSSEEAA